MTELLLPRRGRGRLSPDKEAAYQNDVTQFCDHLKQITSRLDFKVSARGWCYLLENSYGLPKGEFNAAERLITDCRKDGRLPIDICAEDAAREFYHVEQLDADDTSDHATSLLASLADWCNVYQPISFWDDKPGYIQMMVEKIDLRSLFSPICERFYIPLANSRGWSDLHSRGNLMRRFKEHERAGRQCVLLYCGDHDPGGLNISDTLMSNLAELKFAIGWDPKRLIIDRFGLNYDFISRYNLSWIDNLETGSGGHLDDPKHKDHNKPYVQNYLAQYGVRKVEANALVVIPDEGRKLCLDSILKWLGGDDLAPERFEENLQPVRSQLLSVVKLLLTDFRLN